mmetsp:Transcript_51004/g.163995  ORF Transcript_51004/g.163995 Transcript_51004/m.163995 type:complete len:105 (+) Transcript_51004:51-365(+)
MAAQEASAHIVAAVRAAAAAQSQIESQVGDVDTSTLNSATDAFVSSLQAAHTKLRGEIAKRSEDRPRSAAVGSSRDELQLVALRAELMQAHVGAALAAYASGGT